MVLIKYRWMILVIVGLVTLWPLSIFAWNIGGFVSEKEIIFSGITTSQNIINSTGTDDGYLDITLGGAISTLAASSVSMTPAGTAAILRGQVNSLNGLPSVNIYFEWGYNNAYGNVTATQTGILAPGVCTTALMHYDADETVHYRMVCDDGMGNLTYGEDVTFKIAALTAAYSMSKIIPIIAVAILIIAALGMLASGLTIYGLVTLGISLIMGISFISAINAGISLFW